MLGVLLYVPDSTGKYPQKVNEVILCVVFMFLYVSISTYVYECVCVCLLSGCVYEPLCMATYAEARPRYVSSTEA